MDQDFPNVMDGSYVVQFRQVATSKILDTDLNLVIGNKQKVYLIYLSLDSAKAYVSKVLRSNPTVEALIFNAKKERVELLSPVLETF